MAKSFPERSNLYTGRRALPHPAGERRRHTRNGNNKKQHLKGLDQACPGRGWRVSARRERGDHRERSSRHAAADAYGRSSALGGVPGGIELIREAVSFACAARWEQPEQRVGAKHRAYVLVDAQIVPIHVIRRRVAAALLEELDRGVVECEEVGVEAPEACEGDGEEAEHQIGERDAELLTEVNRDGAVGRHVLYEGSGHRVDHEHGQHDHVEDEKVEEFVVEEADAVVQPGRKRSRDRSGRSEKR